MKKKVNTPAEFYAKTRPIETSASVTAFVNRVISKLNVGFSLLLKKDVRLETAYAWEHRVNLAVFYQYMRLRYKIPYYVSMAAYAYYYRKALAANFRQDTSGIGLKITSMYGDGAEDAILAALSRPRFRNLDPAAEFYNEFMRALFSIQRIPSVASIADLETTKSFKNRGRALELINKKRRVHNAAVRALVQELERAVRAPFNPVLSEESKTWYRKNNE